MGCLIYKATKVLCCATICLQLGHPVHLLHGAGHWVHTDNPGEIFSLPERARASLFALLLV